MAVETIVALFPSSAEAENARQQLEAIGIPSENIAVRADPAEASAATVAGGTGDAAPRERGFLDWLFGAEPPESDVARYRTHIEEQGGAALSVRADDRDYGRIVDVLERNNLTAIEIEGATDELARAEAPSTSGAARDEAVLPTASEELEIGKRRVGDTRSYRIRRYVVERPAEAQVSLHDERVVIERRVPTSAAPGAEPFEEKEVEVAETYEEPVVRKRVVPGEEVVVRKEGQDRVETVRDKVRESRVEVDREAAGDKPGTAAPKGPLTDNIR